MSGFVLVGLTTALGVACLAAAWVWRRIVIAQRDPRHDGQRLRLGTHPVPGPVPGAGAGRAPLAATPPELPHEGDPEGWAAAHLGTFYAMALASHRHFDPSGRGGHGS